MNQTDIAETIGCSQPTVSRDINYLLDVWTKESKEDIDRLRARELEELNQMELDAAKSYLKSKQNEKAQETIKWAELRLQIKDRRAKLLGIDKPTKLEHYGNMGFNVVIYLPQKDPDPETLE